MESENDSDEPQCHIQRHGDTGCREWTSDRRVYERVKELRKVASTYTHYGVKQIAGEKWLYNTGTPVGQLKTV